MGFFKEFKDDFSEAVNELLPGEEIEAAENDSLEAEIDVDSELSKLDGLLEQVTKKVDSDASFTEEVKVEEKPVEPVVKAEVKEEKKEVVKETKMPEIKETINPTPVMSNSNAQATDEVAIITKGMSVRGDLESTGSVDVEGAVAGNINCYGKLTVTGVVNGNSSSAEFFADGAKIEGEVATSGTAKIGVGSIVIGNITATSAVIAGAVKGDIDVQGPVVVDTSAVVMGNIKSRSVQINNGAVIEGFCSQCYADVDVENIFA